MRQRVLVIDDHEEIIYAVRRVLADRGFEVVPASGPEEANEQVATVDAAILDIRLGKSSGIELLEQFRTDGHELPVLILSAYASPENIVAASKYGAVEVLRKPISPEELISATEKALEQNGRQEPAPANLARDAGILGDSPEMVEVFKSLGLAATNELSVLLTGETGVGKDVAARIIHEHSRRADGPFVVLNSTALPETLLEAELFGYAEGAFTDAVRSTPGRVESAAGGTLVLDEIGDMPMNCQAKVLRFLEDRSFHRLGESKPRQVDVRVIAATNQDLPSLVEQSRFRMDLYYRLAQIPISIPPLRERQEDIQPLVEGFIANVNRDLGLNIEGILPAAIDAARRHDWPGNVRELKNAVYRTAAKQKSGVIESLDLVSGQRFQTGNGGAGGDRLVDRIHEALNSDSVPKLMNDFERQVLVQALKYYEGNKSRAAQALGMSRNTLRTHLRSHGLDGEPARDSSLDRNEVH